MRKKLLLVSILTVAAFLRFYNLLFDAPYFFNPDERNMANAIIQFHLPAAVPRWSSCLSNQWVVPIIHNGIKDTGPTEDSAREEASECNLNPHFFAYGQFPLYLAFFSDRITQQLWSGVLSPTTEYSQAIFWLRFWSALSSVGMVLVTYLFVRWLLHRHQASSRLRHLPEIAALLVAGTPGLIQSAHFGTTESLLTFFFLSAIYLSARIADHPKSPLIWWLAIIIGTATGTKLTGLFCIVPAAIAAVVQFVLLIRAKQRRIGRFFSYLGTWILFLGVVVAVTIITSPYNIVDVHDFKGSVFGYERDVATGAFRAFYTRQFEQTVPIAFQMEKVFPYALGWFVFVIGLLGFFLILVYISTGLVVTLRQRWQKSIPVIPADEEEMLQTEQDHHFIFIPAALLLVIPFLVYLIPNAMLYAKWTRFMTPIFPFFSLFSLPIIAVLLHQPIFHQRKNLHIILGILSVVALLPGLTFFSIYTRPDVRVTATYWIYQHIPGGKDLLFDTGNVIDIPLGLPDEPSQKPHPTYPETSFDFYHLDENASLLDDLGTHLEKADYIFIPSRRIFKNTLRLPEEYPLTTRYYQALFDGSLGFSQVAEFTSFPALGPWQFPDEDAEETSTVFDHPVIRIYKKNTTKTREEYLRLLAAKPHPQLDQ